MTGNKKVSCKVCYREMRSDHLTRHMKQHSKRNESNPVTNISVTKNYNTTSSVLADREDEVECEAQTTIDEKALERSALIGYWTCKMTIFLQLTMDKQVHIGHFYD